MAANVVCLILDFLNANLHNEALVDSFIVYTKVWKLYRMCISKHIHPNQFTNKCISNRMYTYQINVAQLTKNSTGLNNYKLLHSIYKQ